MLIQSWVDDLADNNKSPFIVTPPLFRLDAGDSNDLRVLLTSAQLPNDRESLFTLNIKVILPIPRRLAEHSAICY